MTHDSTYDAAHQFGELTLRDYLRLLTRQRWLVLAIFGAVLAAAIGFTLLTARQYQSTSSVLLRTTTNTQVFPTVGQSQILQFVRTPAGEFAFVSSSSFQAQASERVTSEATVSPSYDTNADYSSVESQVIDFTATADTPVDAQRAAQVWAEVYLQERSASTKLEIDAAIESISAQIERLEIEKAEILAPLAPIDAVMIGEEDADTVARLTSQRLTLQQSLDDELLPVRFQLRTLSDDLGRLQISQDLAGREDISARINTAAPLGRQVAPQPMRNLALGAVLGALLGVGAALLNDSLRTRISGRDDVELVAPHLQVLAEVPPLPEDGTSAEDRRELSARYNAEMERVVSSVAYQAAHLDGGLRVLVTSPLVGEGKSTLVQQVAQRLTESHIDTIVLDADLRRPVLHDRFGVTNRGTGLSDILGEAGKLSPNLVDVSDVERLRFLPAGAPTDGAAALLRRSFDDAVTELDHPGVLLVDSPPVLAVTDAEVMANSVDRVVVVVRANRTTRSELQQTLERLSATRASILGVVLVGVESKNSRGYGYSYGYGAPIEGAAETTSDVPAYSEASNPVVVPIAATAKSAPAPAPDLLPAAGSAADATASIDDTVVHVPLWLEVSAQKYAAAEAAAAFSEAATGTNDVGGAALAPSFLPSPAQARRQRSAARVAATDRPRPLPRRSETRPTAPMSNSAARGLAPLRNNGPATISTRPGPRPTPPKPADATIDLRHRPERPSRPHRRSAPPEGSR